MKQKVFADTVYEEITFNSSFCTVSESRNAFSDVQTDVILANEQRGMQAWSFDFGDVDELDLEIIGM